MSDPDEPKKETVRITLPPRSGATSREQASGAHDTALTELPADLPAENSFAPEGKRVAPTTPEVTTKAITPTMTRPPISTPSASAVRPPPPRPPSAAATGATLPSSPATAAMDAIPASEVTETPPTEPAMPPRPRILPPPPRVAPPAAAPGSVSAAPANYPGSGTQAGPRKETARISILPETTGPARPTGRMTKTQPLMVAPAAKIHSAPVTIAPGASGTAASGFDAIPLPICWTIFGISAVTLLIQIWNYLAA